MTNTLRASKMDDDEVQVVEVTVRSSTRTASPKKKRKREESPHNSAAETPSSDGNIFQRAAQLKRRLEFCEKEREELTKRFKELKEQLTEQQCCELDVKLETSEKHTPLICVGDDAEDDDVVFILPEDYSPRKRQKIDNDKKAQTFDKTGNQPKKDVAITYYKPATNLPHAREHCAASKFVQSNVTTATVSCNESYCEQCYCYVCDAPVKECDSWKTGTNPHCNAYSKNAFWEKLRKMAKRKASSVQDSLLKCLAADEQSESMLAAAAKAAELLETLKDKLNNSSGNFNSRPSSPSCHCDCHYDSCGSYDSNGCEDCYDYHEDSCGYDRIDWLFGGWARYDRYGFDLIESVSSTISKAKEYLAENQPGPAALVLDALTVVLLPADNERLPSHQVTTAIKSLRKAWIEVLMHPDLPKNVEDNVRERLKNAVNGALICSPESTGLTEILEMRKWNDRLLVKCFAGKLGCDFIKEDEDVVEARLAFLEKNKRFSDALSYMLSCKVMQKNRNLYDYGGVSLTSSEQQLTNIATYRKKFVLLLAKAGKISQALNVLTLPISTDIPKDVMTKTAFKDARGNTPFSQCTLGNMDYASTKELLTAFVNNGSSAETEKIPSPSDIPEETLKKVLAFILTSTQVNSSLRIEQAIEWYINTFCVTSLSNDCPKEKQQEVVKEAELLVTKAKSQFLSSSEIKPPIDVSFKVFVVELFAALCANLYVSNNCYPYFPITTTLETFKRKNLLWACVSVVLSPVLSTKINSQILNFVLVNVIKTLGSRCIPSHIYTSWVNKLNEINGIEKNYEIALCIFKEGQRKSGPDGLSLRKEAVLLVKSLTDAVDGLLGKTGNWSSKDRLSAVLKKIKKDFGKEVSKHGLKDFEGQLMSLCFKNDPSFANFEDVRKTCKGDKWPSLRSSMIEFLRKHRTSHTGCCMEVFARCGMFKEVTLTLAAVGYTGNYLSVCQKIKDTMPKLKKDEACQFVDACADWLGKTLCDVAFAVWRYSYKYMHKTLLSCVRAIAPIKRQTFTEILSGAMRHASELFCRNTVQVKQRADLERWLRDIKVLYGMQEVTAWSWAYHDLTTGPLKRKSAVIRQLKNSAALQSGTLSYHQLISAQASAAVKNTPSSKQSAAQAFKPVTAPQQPGNKAVTTPNSATSAPKVAGNLQGSGSTARSSTAVTTTGYNIHRQSATPATKQLVSPAVSTSSAVPAQKVVVNLPVVSLSNYAASPAVSSRPTTPNKTVYLAAKTTNASVQAVPGPSSTSTGTSLVTTASKGARNPPSVSPEIPMAIPKAIPKPSPAI